MKLIRRSLSHKVLQGFLYSDRLQLADWLGVAHLEYEQNWMPQVGM